VEIKCQLDATDDFYCRSYCLLNMFWGPLCPSSGAREYYTGGCCLWYLVLWFSNCQYGVELRVMRPVCGLQQITTLNPDYSTLLLTVKITLITHILYNCCKALVIIPWKFNHSFPWWWLSNDQYMKEAINIQRLRILVFWEVMLQVTG
jgi:hypothetical protein